MKSTMMKGIKAFAHGSSSRKSRAWRLIKNVKKGAEDMSRHEEFKEREKTINNIFKTLEDADMPEVVKSAIEGGKLEMLTDIADSLAIIADSLKEINARQALKDI